MMPSNTSRNVIGGVTGPIADCLLTLYPARWRWRYETEFRDVLEQYPPSFALFVDVCWNALRAHISYGRAERRIAVRHQAHVRRVTLIIFLLLGRSAVIAGSGPVRSHRLLGGLIP